MGVIFLKCPVPLNPADPGVLKHDFVANFGRSLGVNTDMAGRNSANFNYKSDENAEYNCVFEVRSQNENA
jgi:hypothetical protein